MKYYFKCPKCKNDTLFVEPSQSSDEGLGCLLFFLGGILPALLYAGSTSHRIQCANCGHIFRQPPLPESPVARLSKWLVLTLILFLFLGFLLVVEPAFASAIPKYGWLESISKTIELNPYGTAVGIAAFSLVFLVITVLASVISNARFRTKLESEHKIRPEPFSRFKSMNSNQPRDPSQTNTMR